MDIEEIAKAITTIPAIQLSEIKAALENGIEKARMPEYSDNILSPKEYGMKLMKRKKQHYDKRRTYKRYSDVYI